MTSADVLPSKVEYAPASGGARIATHAEGDGQVLINLPIIPWPNIAITRLVAESSLLGASPLLGAKRRVVTYDARGTGLSHGGGFDFSLEAQLRDLDAVVESQADARVALFAAVNGAPFAIAYAARHPERVSQLILWSGYAQGADFFGRRRVDAIRALMLKDWDLFTRNLALDIVGWTRPQVAGELSAVIREGITPPVAHAAIRTLHELDVRPLLESVQAPTLVVHPSGVTEPPLPVSAALAAGIPDARLVTLEGSALAPFVGDTTALRDQVDAFLEEPPSAGSGVAIARRNPAVTPAGLSSRELEVLDLVAMGRSNEEVARELVVSLATVKKHLHNVYCKLEARNRTHAVSLARGLGLLL